MILALALAGCSDPYQHREPAAVPGERAAKHPVRDAAPDRAVPTVAALIRRAVDLTGNWTGANVADRYAALARISVGDARREARDAAARIPTDRLISREDSRSSVQLQGFVRRGRIVLVVTREVLTAGGTRSRRYRVTRAAVRRAEDGWVLSSWEPQP